MKKIVTIHIQNPKINFNKFDFIISPNHDNIKGANVIKSIGALHQFSKEMIESKKKFLSLCPQKKFNQLHYSRKQQAL